MTDRRAFSQNVIVSAIAVMAFLGGADARAQADTLDDIKARGHMVVAIDPTFSPYEFTDSDGNITGYDPELLQGIAKNLGVEVDFQKMAFDGIIPGLIAGSFDFTSTALNVTAERAKRIGFTIPVSKTQNVVLAAVGGPISSADPATLSGHTAAVKQGTQPEQLIKGLNKTLVSEGKPPISIVSLQTVEQTVEALAAKRADFVVDDVAVLTEVADRSAGVDRVVAPIGDPVYIAWGTRKSDDKLRKTLDAEIEKMEADGRMATLQKKYFHTSFDLPKAGFVLQ